ncbi:secreted RxLR effector protein 161-like [Nicotiana sylvestris]|uniref:secreted RxLR effector protein 161-like n=1 Tax=Nicotiana sylvestris TaxID=4096 RepID=UPI00388C93FB
MERISLNAEEDQDGETLLGPDKVIDMTNGKADMMSQVKELSEDNTVSSSMEPSTSITTTEAEERVVDVVQKAFIGSLLYLTASRPDIVFSVGLYTRFQSNPKESHLKAAKKILRYLKGTPNLVLYYPSGDSFNLIGYADADYAGYLVDRENTSGMAHFLSSCLISWGTRKQNSVALSKAKAEYVAATSCYTQLLWIKQQPEDFGLLT